MEEILVNTKRLRMMSAIAVAFFVSIASSARASIVHDEVIHGDLSNNRFAPTFHILSLGTNSLIATSSGPDKEYVLLNIPPGMQLDAIVLFSYVGIDGTAFMAVQNNTFMSEPATGTNPNNLLGWTHFGPGPGNVGTDILDDMGAAVPSMGFVPPLTEGDYTYWIQQLGSPATYQLDFIVSPEPTTMALFALGVFAIRRRR